MVFPEETAAGDAQSALRRQARYIAATRAMHELSVLEFRHTTAAGNQKIGMACPDMIYF